MQFKSMRPEHHEVKINLLESKIDKLIRIVDGQTTIIKDLK